MKPFITILIAVSSVAALALPLSCRNDSTSPKDGAEPPPQNAGSPDSSDGDVAATPDDPHFEDQWSDIDGDAGATPRGTGADEEAPYAGPKFAIDILVMESFPEQYAALFKVTTNTGGWKLLIDRTAWEGDTLKAYLTLEAPGIDELVTQALEDHEARYAAGTKKIEVAEAYVRLTRRGEGGVQPYRLAATSDSP